MINGLEALTTTSLSVALDAAALRHQVIAANIANAGTKDYVPKRVSFQAQVNQALTYGNQGNTTTVRVSSLIEPDLASNGQSRPVQLDSEVAALSQNTLHYQTLIRALNRQLSILATAVSEGKR